jgi:hypothetical protein
MLKVMDDLFEACTSPKLATSAMIEEIAHLSLDQCENVLKIDQGEESTLENSATSLVTLLDTFGPRLFFDPEFATVSVSFQSVPASNHKTSPFRLVSASTMSCG